MAMLCAFRPTEQEMLRHFISPTQDDWDEHLDAAEFAVNNAWQE